MRNFRGVAVVFILAIFIFSAVIFIFMTRAEADLPDDDPLKPIVSPKPLKDVAATPGEASPFPYFDNYSWRSFIALNWPAMIGAENRGKADETKPFGDTNGPRVWMTWKSRFEIFQPKPEGKTEPDKPKPWNSYEGENPCGKNFKNDATTLRAFTEFHDFNQAKDSMSQGLRMKYLLDYLLQMLKGHCTFPHKAF